MVPWRGSVYFEGKSTPVGNGAFLVTDIQSLTVLEWIGSRIVFPWAFSLDRLYK